MNATGAGTGFFGRTFWSLRHRDRGLLPSGSLVAGALADAWTARFAVLTMGGSIAALSVIGLIALPAMRRA